MDIKLTVFPDWTWPISNATLSLASLISSKPDITDFPFFNIFSIFSLGILSMEFNFSQKILIISLSIFTPYFLIIRLKYFGFQKHYHIYDFYALLLNKQCTQKNV